MVIEKHGKEKKEETLKRLGKVWGITWLAGCHDFVFSGMCMFIEEQEMGDKFWAVEFGKQFL